MLVLLMANIIVGTVIHIVGKKINNTKLNNVADILLKHGTVTLVLFNLFNISFSAGVEWRYAYIQTPETSLSNVFICLCLIGLAVLVVLMEFVCNEQGFG
jgi:hypothetical protein